MSSLVAIVGRPNVGKSTLFNRLTESKDAIIHPVPGVTRDRKYGKAEWIGREFNVIDTGGFVNNSEDKFEEAIRNQVLISIEEADLILFVVDVETGITDHDEVIADILRKRGKQVLVASNKVDTANKEFGTSEFFAFGLSDVIYPISAANGYGTGELLDKIIEVLPDTEESEENEVPKIAVVGKPNVGKSTFINTILDQNRNIVTDEAGTTRDSVDTHYTAFGFDFIITDTAGLRKKSRIDDNLEFYSTIRTIKAIESCDVCILLIDGSDDIGKQDLSIFYQIVKSKKGIVLAVNKWDLVEKDTHTHDKILKQIRERISPFTDVPVIFTSNITKQRILKTLELALEVYQNKIRKVSTSTLNELILEEIENRPPPAYKGKYVKIKYITQLPSKSPAFAFFCNLPQYIKDPYKRFLENKIREHFNFHGVPIRIFFRKK
ncbi:MAG: ribosome biogenesis GTPase Der [Flavobacteriales bacterium]|nr:ribosome biogenesis GTPase Der [Flavobacteriales bacterium]